MKTAILCALLAIPALSRADINAVKHHVTTGTPTSPALTGFSKSKLDTRYLAGSTGGLQAGFTVIGSESGQETVWGEDFEASEAENRWTLNNADSFSWEFKKMDGNYSFTGIDPNDTQSLFIEGHYRYANRGTASAISPEITIPQNATFTGYVGYSYNFVEDATMTIFASDDGEEWQQLWSCLEDAEDRTWHWHKFSIDMTAYSGKTVRIKFEYGNTEASDNAGYMGDYAIDGLEIVAATDVTGIDVMTGETVRFADTSTGNPTAWEWKFPGGTPSESTEQYPTVYYTRDGKYDVTLTVSDGTGTSTTTKTGFVTVTGIAPTAKIMPPATFRYNVTRLPMVAPLAPVEFRDASEGFPTDWQWTFTGTSDDAGTVEESTEENPTVNYMFQHEQTVALTVGNEHGSSSDEIQVSAEYEGFINNLQPGDNLHTFDLGDGYGEFPGTNYLKITEYAEKFSKPSRPVFISGVTVYFTQYSAVEVIDQIANIKVALCKSENGLPGEQIDFASWSAFELNMPQGSILVGTDFEFSKPAIVDDEFFTVVSGIPEKNETCTISFATAQFRGEGNTAYFKQDGVWKAASDYFPAGSNHTSYAISPYIAHSVMAPLSADNITVGPQKGEASFEIFSLFGYQTPVECDSEWCRVVNEPNGMTVDNITVGYDDLPAGITTRTATLTLTDGASTLALKLTQDKNSATAAVERPEARLYPSVFDTELNIVLPDNARTVEIISVSGNIVHKEAVDGRTAMTVDGSQFAPGVYIVRIVTESSAIILKAAKQ